MNRSKYVIDSHAHFGIQRNKELELENERNPIAKKMLKDFQQLKSSVGYTRSVVEDDNNLEDYIEVMKKNNIAIAWLHQLSFENELGYEILSNIEISKAIQKYPNIFRGFAGVNPYGKNAIHELEYAINTLGLHAFKLNPNDYGGFILNNKELLYPLYEKCCEFNIPISVHTGITPGTMYRMKNNYPILLDDVAVDFPELTIIVEHMGFPWNDLCYYMVSRHPNMYITITAVANILIHNSPKIFLIQLCRMIEMLGSEKILWGSDWTATPNIDEVLEYLDAIDVPFIMRKVMNLKQITQKDIRNILYNNSLKILK
jgi:predicted TIM-barrel fold metal-dependent hydrolase